LSEKIDWVNVSKGIAIILVVIAHNITVRSPLFTFIFAFHMPFFFIISGYLYSNKSLKVQVKNNYQRLILPYIATSLLLIMFMILRSLIKGQPTNIFNLVASILYSSGVPPTQFSSSIISIGALWFLTCLFCATIIFNILIKLTKDYNKYIQFSIITTLSLIGFVIGELVYLPWSLDIALSSQIFIYSGYYLRSNNILNKTLHIMPTIVMSGLLILSVCISTISMNSRLYQNIIVACLGAISGSILLIYISKYISKFLLLNRFFSYLGQQTLVILCFHVLEAHLFPWAYLKLLYGNTFALIICKLILLISITFILKYIPFIRMFFYYKQYPFYKIKNNHNSLPS